MTNIELLPLEQPDWEQFIKDNQEAFNYGALEEFGRRDWINEQINGYAMFWMEKI